MEQTARSTSTINAAAVPAATTDVVATQSGYGEAFRPAQSPRTKVYNTAGITYVKGGSQLGAGFFDCVTTSYTNLVNSPVALVLIIIGTVGLIATHQKNLSPLDLTYNALLTTANDKDSPNFARSIASFFAYVLSLILSVQDIILTSSLFGGIYIAKPSRNNAWLCSILTLVCILGNFEHILIALLGHFTLMFTQIRSPAYKFIIFFLAFICIIMGFNHISQLVGLKTLTSVKPTSNISPPVTASTHSTTTAPPVTTSTFSTTTASFDPPPPLEETFHQHRHEF